MRLQLSLLMALAPTAALSNPEIDARASVFVDTDKTTISTDTIAVRAQPIENVGVKARYLVDAVSSASVDVVSAATERFKELRHEAEGAVGYDDGSLRASATYVFSVEPDWRSHTVSGAVSHDFLAHNLTVGVSGSYQTNTVWRAHDDNFERSLEQIGVGASAVLTPSPLDLVRVAYGLASLSGYQASPYRFARFMDPLASGQLLTTAERHPDRRVRHNVTVNWNRHVFTDSAIRSHARLYLDDWGIASVTGGTEYVVGFGGLQLGLSARAYAQTRARFYEDIYPQRRRFMTADRELSPFFDLFGGARLSWRGPVAGLDELRADVRVTGFSFVFSDFARLPSRAGLIAELGLGVDF